MPKKSSVFNSIMGRYVQVLLSSLDMHADAFMMQEDTVPDIMHTYRKLRKKGTSLLDVNDELVVRLHVSSSRSRTTISR